MGNSLPCLSHAAKTSKTKASGKKKPKIRRNKAKIMYDQIISNLIPDEKHEDQEKIKGVIRVKMVLTKKEAELLLSTLSNNDDIIYWTKSLGRIEKESRRSNIHGSWRPELESIPEI
ncbi:uncharacterized protein LOC109838842 [Asparagus officinalis]|uniref:uncharacterized protein LOC109838842 n=1 Tax=Asparagus officinalis TaxID=4686 RepID=UPI00098E859D|nr:uncharacterized protein LOC109838842 [Asparagus officinalis]